MKKKTPAARPAARDRGFLQRLQRKPDLVALPLLFALTFSLNVSAAARTVTFSDSGDFLMGIWSVGNIHGPGYPLYLMTAKVFGWLLPFGSPALKASIYSGLFSALTACLLYWIVYRLTSSRLSGAVAGLAYAFSFTFWYQSVIPETYSLNGFFISLMVVLALRWEKALKDGRTDKADNTLCAFALVLGLALTNHVSVLFLLPAFVFFALDTDWRSVLAPRNVLRMIAFLALGLLPYIYQPAAAFRGPAYNYGDPSTPLRWFRHMTAYYQREGLFEYPYMFLPGRFLRYFSTLLTEYPYSWWLAAVGVLSSLTKRKRKYGLFLLLLFLLALVPIMTYRQSEPVLRAHFYYESYLVVAIWLGMGAALILKLAGRLAERYDRLVGRAVTAVLAALLVLVPLAGFVEHYQRVDKSDYTYARDMALEMLGTAREPGSVILVDDDNVIFPLEYMQVVEGRRPDVRVVSTVSAGVPGFQGMDLRVYTPPGYVASGSDTYTEIVERNHERLPLYTAIPTVIKYSWPQQWLGHLTRLFPPETATSKNPTRRKAQVYASRVNRYMDSDARWAVLFPGAMEASFLYSGRDYPGADSVYSEILPAFHDDIYVSTLYGASFFASQYEFWGAVLNQQGKFRETAREVPKGRDIDPDFHSLYLARAYGSLGDFEAARDELEIYVAFESDNVQARVDLAEMYFRLEDYPRAEQEVENALRISSDNANAHLLKGVILLRLDRSDEARAEFEEVIKLDPQGPASKPAAEYLESM